MAHRSRKKLDPVDERRRALAVKWIGLTVLILIALYLVIRALEVP